MLQTLKDKGSDNQIKNIIRIGQKLYTLKGIADVLSECVVNGE